jgi:cytochrome b subunit of formate dehydrogenase/NAD-dependent dihydropyrimidine dehydrogenase PreA subunit
MKITINIEKPKVNKRIFHWIIAAAFVALFATGLIIYTPQFSALASGGATRIIHKIAAVTLIAGPIVYALFKPSTARQWLREAAIWRKLPADSQNYINPWRRKHKLLISIGIVLLALTGALQWFFKDLLPDGVFDISLFIHGILFFSAIVLLLYHLYFEFYWWLWKKRYCGRCNFAYCADACPAGAIADRDGTIVRDSLKCNNCRLCMQDCQRKAHYRKIVQPQKDTRPVKTGPVEHSI